ncbi:MAG: BON domain-containing protein [Gemmatimonadota bacterium]
MTPYRWPHPRERFAETYRRAHEAWDRTPVDRLERAGFGHRHGFHGRYMDRPGYRRRLGDEYPPEPAGSGWPHPLRELPASAIPRHLRAIDDRELARAVDLELYRALGRTADRITVWADDGVITLDGPVPRPATAERAVQTARRVPGVRRVRDALAVRRRPPRSSRRHRRWRRRAAG